jgi:hypothetical protein
MYGREEEWELLPFLFFSSALPVFFLSRLRITIRPLSVSVCQCYKANFSIKGHGWEAVPTGLSVII